MESKSPYAPETPATIALADGWESQVIQRLRAMVARRESALISVVAVGRDEIILIDRRLPAGRVIIQS